MKDGEGGIDNNSSSRVAKEDEREEYMLKSVGKYIKKTKRKLHQYELTLQNQPDLERALKSEFIEFDRKLYGNLVAGKHSAKLAHFYIHLTFPYVSSFYYNFLSCFSLC